MHNYNCGTVGHFLWPSNGAKFRFQKRISSVPFISLIRTFKLLMVMLPQLMPFIIFQMRTGTQRLSMYFVKPIGVPDMYFYRVQAESCGQQPMTCLCKVFLGLGLNICIKKEFLGLLFIVEVVIHIKHCSAAPNCPE